MHEQIYGFITSTELKENEIDQHTLTYDSVYGIGKINGYNSTFENCNVKFDIGVKEIPVSNLKKLIVRYVKPFIVNEQFIDNEQHIHTVKKVDGEYLLTKDNKKFNKNEVSRKNIIFNETTLNYANWWDAFNKNYIDNVSKQVSFILHRDYRNYWNNAVVKHENGLFSNGKVINVKSYPKVIVKTPDDKLWNGDVSELIFINNYNVYNEFASINKEDKVINLPVENLDLIKFNFKVSMDLIQGGWANKILYLVISKNDITKYDLSDILINCDRKSKFTSFSDLIRQIKIADKVFIYSDMIDEIIVKNDKILLKSL